MGDPNPEDFEAQETDIPWATFSVTGGGVITIDNIDHSAEAAIPVVEAEEVDTSSIWYRDDNNVPSDPTD